MSTVWNSLKHHLRAVALAWLKQAPLQLQIHAQIEHWQDRAREKDSKSLLPFGHKVYSQCDEDGIIAEIFQRIGVTNRYFVEIGVGDGLENNTLALLFQGWRGLWVEGSPKRGKAIKEGFAPTLERGDLVFLNRYVNAENIDEMLTPHVPEQEIDLLSIDIDGNDYHVYEAICCCRPRVLIFEYNAKFAPPISFCLDYNPEHVWQGDDCFGVSLKYLETHLGAKGYKLVGCNLLGANAFFVREDLVGEQFSQPYTAEHHYQPMRYFLARYASGHRPSYETLNRSLHSRQKS